ncbi:hypothetical protein QUF50_02510 [Thiotrichales bacterium HSG1]|nr:hypothetical protein [Thiotrichales bacterium HSG1]
MKKFILPAVISLVISGSYVFAEESTQEVKAATTPVVTAPPPMAVPPPAANPDMEKYRQEIKKHIAEQQAAMEKRMTEQQAAMKEQMIQQQKQHQEMMEERTAKMQEMQKRHEKMRAEHTSPAWTKQPAPPASRWNAPPYAQPRYNNQPVPKMHNRASHHVNIEKSLHNIEKLLEEVIEILQKK